MTAGPPPQSDGLIRLHLRPPTTGSGLHVHVGPGAVVPVFYADPASRFFGGSLGTRHRQDWALRCLQAGGVLAILSMLVGFIRA